MADETPKESLKDFLTKRAGNKSPPSQIPSAPTPQSESSDLPNRMTPPPRQAPQRPGMFRQMAGAFANEALKGTGALGIVTTQRISGAGRSGMARAPTYSGTAHRVNLSKAARVPDGKQLRGVEEVEQAIILLDQNHKEFSQYITNEFKSVREDIEKVSTIASNAARAVEQLKRDAKANAFKNSVAKGSIRGKNGRFMTSDQADEDPNAVGFDGRIKPPGGGGLFDAVWGYAKEYGAYAAGGAATLYGAKKASGLATNLARRKAAEKAAEIVTKKTASSFAGNVAKSVVGGKGGGIGTGIAILKTMKDDSESGNHLRTWLRGKLGIEDDPNELAPWQKSGATRKPDAVKAPSVGDAKIDSPDSIEIESKKNIIMTAIQDIRFEARNEFVIKARNLIIDAEKIEFRGNAKLGDGAAVGTQGRAPVSRPPLMSTPLSTDEQRYDENVAKYGRVKADELKALDERSTNPMNLFNKFRPSKMGGNPGGGSGVNVGEAGSGPQGGRANTDGSMRGDDLRKGVYNAFRAQGYSHQGALTMAGEVNRENSFNPDLVFGNHSDPHNKAKNSGMFSWQGSRNPELMAHLASRGALDEKGNIKRDQNALNAQAEFVKMEMSKKEYGGGRLNDVLSQEKFDRNAVADDIGKNYIKWRVDDPTYRPGGVRNRDAGYESTRRAVEDGSITKRPGQSDYKEGTERLFHQAGNLGGINPKLTRLMKDSSRDLPEGYRAEIISGHDARSTGTTNHPNGLASDIKIYDAEGKLVPYNRGGPGMAVYEQFHQSIVERGKVLYPKEKFIWGGTWISAAAGHGDPMHMQIVDKNVPGSSTTSGAYDPDRGAKGHQFEPYLMNDEQRSAYKQKIRERIAAEQAGGDGKTPKDESPNAVPVVANSRVMVDPGSAAVAPGFKIGKGDIAGHIDKDGKLGFMATSFARQKIIDGMGENFAKLPKNVQEHLKNSSQLDLNLLAPHQNLMPEAMKKGFADNGLTFTPGKDAVSPTYKDHIPVKNPDEVPDGYRAFLGKKSEIVPVQTLEGAAPDADPTTSDMARGLGAGDLDKASGGEMIRGVPTPPNLQTNEDPDAGQRVTDSIKQESTKDTEKGSSVSDHSKPSESAQTGRSSAHDIKAPVNHPESEAPRPGSDGYGDQQHDPDDCGLCAT
jgi:hypothetical protein